MPLRDRGQLVLDGVRQDGSGRVARVAEEQRLRPRRDRRFDRRRIQGEVVLETGRHVADRPTGEYDGRHVRDVRGLVEDDLVAGIAGCPQGEVHRLRRADGDQHLGRGVVGDAVAPLEVGRERLPELERPVVARVMRPAVVKRADAGRDDPLRRIEVRLPYPEADDVVHRREDVEEAADPGRWNRAHALRQGAFGERRADGVRDAHRRNPSGLDRIQPGADAVRVRQVQPVLHEVVDSLLAQRAVNGRGDLLGHRRVLAERQEAVAHDRVDDPGSRLMSEPLRPALLDRDLDPTRREDRPLVSRPGGMPRRAALELRLQPVDDAVHDAFSLGILAGLDRERPLDVGPAARVVVERGPELLLEAALRGVVEAESQDILDEGAQPRDGLLRLGHRAWASADARSAGVCVPGSVVRASCAGS